MLVWHGSSRFKSPNKESLRDAMYTLAGKTKALVLHSRELAFSSQPELLPTCQRQYDFNGGKHLPLKLVIAHIACFCVAVSLTHKTNSEMGAVYLV